MYNHHSASFTLVANDSESQSRNISEKNDNAKLTMRTRVAVRGQMPHRFHVIPLHEIGKEVLYEELDLLPSRRPQDGQPNLSRSGNISIHRGDHKEPDCQRRCDVPNTSMVCDEPKITISERRILHERDINVASPILDTSGNHPSHKRGLSLVPLKLQQTLLQDNLVARPSIANTFVPSHVYSQSLSDSEYSFQLNPRKVYNNSGLDASQLRDPPSESTQPQLSRTMEEKIHPNLPNFSEQDSSSAAKKGKSSLRMARRSHIRARPKTLSESITASRSKEMGFHPKIPLPTTIEEVQSEIEPSHVRRRHAIYSQPPSVSFKRQIKLNEGDHLDDSKDADADTIKISNNQFDCFRLLLENDGNVNLHSIPLKDRDESTINPSSESLKQSSPFLVLPPTRPLKLVRTSIIRPASEFDTEVVYSQLVLDMMKNLDEAIEGWNNI